MYTTPHYPHQTTSTSILAFWESPLYNYHQSSSAGFDMNYSDFPDQHRMNGTETSGTFDYQEDVSDFQVLLNALCPAV